MGVWLPGEPRSSQKWSRSVQKASEGARGAQGLPRRGSKMEPLSFRKIGKLSSEMRLAASWGPKIAQIGSLARWKIIPGHPL